MISKKFIFCLIIVFMVNKVETSTSLASKIRMMLPQVRQLATKIKVDGPLKFKTIAAEAKQDMKNRWKELAKSTAFWGGLSAAYYTAYNKMPDWMPESSIILPDERISSLGVPIDIKDVVVNREKTTWDNRDNPEARWMRNGKGLLGNFVALFPPDKPYIDDQQRLRLPYEYVEKLEKGDVADIKQMSVEIEHAIERYQNDTAFKTAVACTANTTLMTPFFMLTPVGRAIQIAAKMKKADTIAEFGVPIAVNYEIKQINK